MNKFKNKKILKCFCNKIGDYYEYMSSQIQNEKIIKERIIKDDVDELLKIIKCPMTDMNLEIEKDFLKASVMFIYLAYLLSY